GGATAAGVSRVESSASAGAIGSGIPSSISFRRKLAKPNESATTFAMGRLVPLALAGLSFLLLPPDVLAVTHRARSRSGGHRAVPGLTREGLPNIQAQAAVIVDLRGGGEYYTKNPDAVRPIASISKLMAGLLVMDRGINLDGTQTITVDDRKVALK